MTLRRSMMTRPMVWNGRRYAAGFDPVVLDPVHDDPVTYHQHPFCSGGVSKLLRRRRTSLGAALSGHWDGSGWDVSIEVNRSRKHFFGRSPMRLY